MIEIKNKTKGPIQIMVRSRTAPKSFTTQIVKGIGSGQHICYIEDEKKTDYIDEIEKKGLISVKYISNNNI